MTPRLSIAIVAHPKRTEHVEWMLERLNAQVVEARAAGYIVYDPTVSWDHESRGCWWNTRQALLQKHPEATHHLEIEDDITFCADFPQAVCEVLKVRSMVPLSFYNCRGMVTVAKERGLHWAATRSFLAGVAVCMPVWMIDHFVRWADAREDSPQAIKEQWGKHEDVRMQAFFKARHYLPVYITVPTLVEHVGHQNGIGSILGHYGPVSRRMSADFIGEDGRGAEVPWHQLEEVQEWKVK